MEMESFELVHSMAALSIGLVCLMFACVHQQHVIQYRFVQKKKSNKRKKTPHNFYWSTAMTTKAAAAVCPDTERNVLKSYGIRQMCVHYAGHWDTSTDDSLPLENSFVQFRPALHWFKLRAHTQSMRIQMPDTIQSIANLPVRNDAIN